MGVGSRGLSPSYMAPLPEGQGGAVGHLTCVLSQHRAHVSLSMVQLLPLVCPHQAVSCAEAGALSLFCSPGPGMLDEQ